MANKKKKEKENLWKNVWVVVANKEDTGGEFMKGALVGVLSGVLNALAIIFCLFAVAGLSAIIGHLFTTDWSTRELVISNIVICVVVCIICLIALTFALVLRGFANEVGREKKMQNIVSIFSAFTGFAALVVASIALVVEVTR